MTGRPRHFPEGSVEIKTEISADVSAAISALAKASGASKYAFVRSLIFAGLQPFAITDPELAAKLPATTYTRGAA
ncbi:hypothetical protein ACTJKK_02380 [Microbacterium sp. 22179]|uniref:hypothetical protein n=1 Tax=Microbacterium sp. 22179 TaxID=3453886 RepID=UPI003F851383